MIVDNVAIVTNGDMTADVTSTMINIGQLMVGSIQAVWTGTPVGNFTIELSNDVGQTSPDGSVTGVTNWSLYTGSTQAAGGAAGNFMWLLDDLGAKWVRFKYTHSSSTGTLNARLNFKAYS